MPDYNGEAATVLPNIMPSIGDELRYMQDRQDRNQYREDQLRSQAAAKKLQLVNFVEANADPGKFLIGQSNIDQHATEQIEAIKSELLQQVKNNPNLDSGDLAYAAQQKLAPLSVAHAKQQAIADNINANLEIAKKHYPSLNMEAVRTIARKNAFVKQLADGTLTYKDPEQLDSSKDYVADAIANYPESAVDNEAALIKNIQSYKPNTISAKTGDMYAGVRTKNSYKAQLSPFREVDMGADGTASGLKYKTEDITLPGGEKLQVAPQEQFDAATSTPDAMLAFNKVWNQNKQKYGVGNLPIDDPTSKIMQRKFLLDYLKATNIDHSSYSSDDETYKTAAKSNEEAGYGTPIQQYQQREALRQQDALARQEKRNQDATARQAQGFENRKTLKQIPAGKATPNRKKTGASGLN